MQGIPTKLRRQVWLIISGAQKEINQDPNYYSSLCELTKITPLIYEKQIEVDLERTDISDGCQSIEEKQKAIPHLRQILQCFSLRNSTIGYCQGFNYIVAKIFQITQDEVRIVYCITFI